jgi:hypothetical protein
MTAIHLLSCDEHSAEVLRDAASELGLPLTCTRKPPRSEFGRREIVIIDGDRAESMKALETARQGAVCIGLIGEDSAALELLEAGVDLILHKPVFSEWAKVCLKQACCAK